MRRGGMKKIERESRSRLKPYIQHEEFLRGTLTMREHTCGKINCKCNKGDKHKSLYLSRSNKGKVEQLYISKEKEEMVKKWVEEYHEIQNLLEKISSSYWDRLKNRR